MLMAIELAEDIAARPIVRLLRQRRRGLLGDHLALHIRPAAWERLLLHQEKLAAAALDDEPAVVGNWPEVGAPLGDVLDPRLRASFAFGRPIESPAHIGVLERGNLVASLGRLRLPRERARRLKVAHGVFRGNHFELLEAGVREALQSQRQHFRGELQGAR